MEDDSCPTCLGCGEIEAEVGHDYQRETLPCPTCVSRELREEITRLRALLSAYEARLEIDHAWRLVDGKLTRFEIPPEDRPNWPDGITCRDETIKLLEEQLGRARQRHDGE
jgi:hypothetical protein